MDYEALSSVKEQLVDRGYSADLNDPQLFDELLEALVPVLKNPRDIKRIVSGFAAIEPATKGEVHQADVLGYAALSALAPKFRDFLEINSERIVNDPITVDEHFRR
jgi:hypothetical protein